MSHGMLDCVCVQLLPFEDWLLLGDYIWFCQVLCCVFLFRVEAHFLRRKEREEREEREGKKEEERIFCC